MNHCKPLIPISLLEIILSAEYIKKDTSTLVLEYLLFNPPATYTQIQMACSKRQPILFSNR